MSEDINVLLRSTVHRLMTRPRNAYAMIFNIAANHIQMYSSPICSIVLRSIQHPMQRRQAEFQAKQSPRRLTIPRGTIYVALNYIRDDQQDEDNKPDYSQHDEGKFRWRPPAKRKYLQHVHSNSLSAISHIAVIFCVNDIPTYYEMNLLGEYLQTCLETYLSATPTSPICFRRPSDDKS